MNNPVIMYCNNFEHQYEILQCELKENIKYHSKMLYKLEYFINILLKRTDYYRIVPREFILDYIKINILQRNYQYIPIKNVFDKYISEFNIKKQWHLDKMRITEFEYLSKIIHIYPWIKDLIYSYLL